MDRELSRLKRQASIDNTFASWQTYIHALERVVGYQISMETPKIDVSLHFKRNSVAERALIIIKRKIDPNAYIVDDRVIECTFIGSLTGSPRTTIRNGIVLVRVDDTRPHREHRIQIQLRHRDVYSAGIDPDEYWADDRS